MRKRLSLILLCALGLSGTLFGCGKKEEAVAVVTVEEAEEEETASEETWEEDAGNFEGAGGSEALEESDILKEPGTVLGEETMSLFQDGQEQEMVLCRVQGSFEYSLAYDPSAYTFVPGDMTEEDIVAPDQLLIGENAEAGEESSLCMNISENLDYALEELADELVLNCPVECVVEDLTIGEEEYPATWISYVEETEGTMYQVDSYLVGFETHVFWIQMMCPVDQMDSLGADQQIILSTLRFHSAAEG